MAISTMAYGTYGTSTIGIVVPYGIYGHRWCSTYLSVPTLLQICVKILILPT